MRDDKGQQILQRVSDHSWPYGTPPPRKRACHQTTEGDHESRTRALVCVADAEQRGRKEDSDRYVPGDGGELTLQVAAIDGLFADAGAESQKDPQTLFVCCLRHEKPHRGIGAGGVGVWTQNRYDKNRNAKECDGDSYILQCLTGRAPTISEDGAQRRSVQPNTG